MIPELGQFALIVALLLAVAQTVFGLAGAQLGRPGWMAAVRPAVAGQFVFVAAAFALLTASFLANDFSVRYVAMNSNTALPVFYRVAAVWGAHEGSLLLWILVLALWTLAVAAFSRNLPPRFAARVLGTMGFVAVGFMLFTLLTSNPFDRLLVAPAEGRDLNPLLQDPALAIHPPMLYMGYVGFSVAFGFAVAAMIEGRLDAAWARWTRPWTTASWLFLTLGIALGSWWAYYELGWGGWWFWDPVENASFMPWLVGTALIHSLAVTEKRGLFPGWTLLLAVFAFSLSLLGTFLVRSGVLVSVHAFATDATRGLFILIYMAIVVFGALALYAWRAPRQPGNAGFGVLSRESFLLGNNVLLTVAAGVVLFGTLYPLFSDALGLGKVSIGPQWFDPFFLLPMLPLSLLVGVGMHSAWKRGNGRQLRRRLWPPAAIALAAGVLVPLAVYGGTGVLTAVGVATGLWVIASALIEPAQRLLRRAAAPMPRSTLGMIVAHIGVGVFILGVTVTRTYSVETDVGLAPGESATAAGYTFTLEGTEQVSGPNYLAEEATVTVSRDGREVTVLRPQKRVYRVQRNPMTEAGIDSGLARDVYVALGEPLGNDAWSMRLQYKPLVRFIWLGAALMALGGAIATTDRRYRAARAAQPAAAPGVALGEGA